MKNKFFLMVVACTLLLVMSCNNAVNVDQILKDKNTRQQVFNKVVADHEMMTNFMEVMMKDNHAKMMMKGNQGMKEMMMGEGDMMSMMKDKPDMMQNMMGAMMGAMMKDGKMMGDMMQMMKDKGMMSEECMESCMKMMGEEGMSMDGKVGNNKADNHDSHNH